MAPSTQDSKAVKQPNLRSLIVDGLQIAETIESQVRRLRSSVIRPVPDKEPSGEAVRGDIPPDAALEIIACEINGSQQRTNALLVELEGALT